MRLYVLARLSELEIGIILAGFRHAEIMWDKTSHEFRRLFFGSPFERIYNGVPFSPCEPHTDGTMRPIKIGNPLADQVREEFLNKLDNEGGGLYPIGILLNTKTFLEALRGEVIECGLHESNVVKIDNAIRILDVSLQGVDAASGAMKNGV